MTKNSFTEDDKKKLVEFLNFVAEKADFNMNTQDVIRYFTLLSFMQKELLPKVDSHILEVKRVIEPENEDSK